MMQGEYNGTRKNVAVDADGKVQVGGISLEGDVEIDSEAIATAIDTALRATPLPVTGELEVEVDNTAVVTAIEENAVDVGTAGSPSADVVSIQGVSGGTAVPVTVSGVATEANQTTIIGKLPDQVGGRIPVTLGTAIPAGTNNIGDVDVLSLPSLAAGENQIGKVGGSTAIIAHTLSSDTGALGAGDIVATTEAISNALRVNDGTGILQSLMLIDEADQKAALDIYFLSANSSMGTENSAPNISDANAANILGVVSIATGDYKDLGGVSIANIKGIGLALQAASGTRTLYVAVVNGAGTPTYGAAGALKLRLGILQD